MPRPKDGDARETHPRREQAAPFEDEAVQGLDPELARELAEAAEALAEVEGRGPGTDDLDLVPSEGTLPSTESIESSTLSFVQSFNRQLDEIQEVKETLESDVAGLKMALAEREKALTQERERVAELEQRLGRVPELEEACRQLQDQLEARGADIEAMQAEVRAREVAIQQKDASIAELSASHDAMVAKSIELKEEIQGLKRERARMSAQLEAAAGEKEEILAEKRRVEQAMNQLDAKYQSAHDEVMSARKILGELQSAFETSQRKARAILDKKVRGASGSTG